MGRAIARFSSRRFASVLAVKRVIIAAAILAVLAPGRAEAARLTGIHKIRHVVVIMEENRSFDSYFGTYPGADGIPRGVCVPDPQRGRC
jgi:phospholipase C